MCSRIVTSALTILLGCCLFAAMLSAQESDLTPAGVPANCPTVMPSEMSEQLLQNYKDSLEVTKLDVSTATALVGVDALGRIAVGLDLNNDSFVEKFLLFTAQTRLDGPWQRYLFDTKVKLKHGGLLITSKREKFALSAAVAFAKQPTVPSWAADAFSVSDGREFVRKDATTPAISLSDLKYDDIATWPESFWYDLLDPGTASCYDEDCEAGGVGSTGCSFECGESCSVSGCVGVGGVTYFACCKCEGWLPPSASCRCRACTPFPVET